MDIYHYPVVDCEHEGDMRSAEFEVTDAGAKVIDTYWDGEDCGDAYIEFTCAPKMQRSSATNSVIKLICYSVTPEKIEVWQLSSHQITRSLQ